CYSIGGCSCCLIDIPFRIDDDLRRGFHYYLWLYCFAGNGAFASHIWGWRWENMLDFGVLDLIAELIVACEPPPKHGPGHPRSEIVRVVATLRRFLREGLPWRSLRATVEQASGSTLRRFLAY